MLKLRRVCEAKTLFEQGWDALCNRIKELIEERNKKAERGRTISLVNKRGDRFSLRLGNKKDSDVLVKLSLSEGFDGVYAISIDGVSGRVWRISDNEIVDKKTGKMKKFNKDAQINNMLDVAMATMDKKLAQSSAQSSNKESDSDTKEKTEGIRRLYRKRFI